MTIITRMEANQHQTTRREFATTAASAVTLTVMGCGEQSTSGDANPRTGLAEMRKKARLATAPFDVGPVDQYRSPGVYDAYWDEKDVYLISDGERLAAVAALCTHLNCTTHWKKDEQHFYCPCHESMYDASGKPMEGAKAKRPLDRCAISIVETPMGEQVRVDPTVRFREDEDEWEDSRSFLIL